MTIANKFLVEGLDRVGKDTLLLGIQHRRGYHQVLHYKTPLRLNYYLHIDATTAERQYQEASFHAMFQFLNDTASGNIICNRAHLGECVYAPLYRGYSGDYVFEIERLHNAQKLRRTRLILLTEDFDVSNHFKDDGKSLGHTDARHKEQNMFIRAFENSTISDKKIICVTDRITGGFRHPDSILDEALG